MHRGTNTSFDFLLLTLALTAKEVKSLHAKHCDIPDCTCMQHLFGILLKKAISSNREDAKNCSLKNCMLDEALALLEKYYHIVLRQKIINFLAVPIIWTTNNTRASQWCTIAYSHASTIAYLRAHQNSKCVPPVLIHRAITCDSFKVLAQKSLRAIV